MNYMNSRILITGGAGLVGSHLARRLLDHGATVRVADDLSKGDRTHIPNGAEFIKADLTERNDVEQIITEDLDIALMA